MENEDLVDTHLCIKCHQAIVGLERYLEHRKSHSAETKTVNSASCRNASTSEESFLYEDFNYTAESLKVVVPSTTANSDVVDKTTKLSSNDGYELHCDLGADLFFSSLQLQSVQSSIGGHTSSNLIDKTSLKSSNITATTTAITTNVTNHDGHPQRPKALSSNSVVNIPSNFRENWTNSVTNNSSLSPTERFLKVTRTDNKNKYDIVFKSLSIEETDVEMEDGSEEDDEEDHNDVGAKMNVCNDEYFPPSTRQSSPVVPITHTGGKWKPELRPHLQVEHHNRLYPNWEDPAIYELDVTDGLQHPPSDHTKGKWLPGSTDQKTIYKEIVSTSVSTYSNNYWCYICCRKLKSKLNYENHLKSQYHLKRKHSVKEGREEIDTREFEDEKNITICQKSPNLECLNNQLTIITKRKRKMHNLCKNSYKTRKSPLTVNCNICKRTVCHSIIGKHLISHYHFRKAQNWPKEANVDIILNNIHSIVLQSPFQCRICRFYTNTEEMFQLHWDSKLHQENSTKDTGLFCCYYCRYECAENSVMRQHLLSKEHKEVILAINRSSSIQIGKRSILECTQCKRKDFFYNFELRLHWLTYHSNIEIVNGSSISDQYQDRYPCSSCPELFRSRTDILKHEKLKHSISKYFCWVCSIEFATPCQARKHRKAFHHNFKSLYQDQKVVKENSLSIDRKLDNKIDNKIIFQNVNRASTYSPLER